MDGEDFVNFCGLLRKLELYQSDLPKKYYGQRYLLIKFASTVKLGDKERFDKEQIGVKEPFPVINCQFTS